MTGSVVLFVLAVFLAILPVIVRAGPPSVTVVKRPVKPLVELGSALAYRVQVRPNPHRSDEAVLGGRKVRFKPAASDDKVEVVGVGQDGTVLLHRSYYGLYPVDRWTIDHGLVEVPVLAYGRPVYVDEYHSARDYAGAYYEPGDEPGATPPRKEPNAFVREKGRTRLVGRGYVVAWNPGGAVATKVQVDADGRPAGYELASEEHIRVFDEGRTYDLGKMRYVGPASDGAFVFADEKPGTGVYRWRRGRLQPWGSLPQGWTALTTDARNCLLAREGEDGWSVAILCGTRLRPLRFAHPAHWRDFGWDEARLYREGRVVIDASQGIKAEPRTVVLTPR